jgi:hypothetical protein
VSEVRFVSLVKSVLGKTRRSLTQSESTNVVNPDKDDAGASTADIVRTMRKLSQRIARLEAVAQAESTEFEVVVGTGGATSELYHGYGGPVRWWVTTWMQQPDLGASPTTAPILVRDTSSTGKILILQSYVAGRAVIRVEPSNYDMDP